MTRNRQTISDPNCGAQLPSQLHSSSIQSSAPFKLYSWLKFIQASHRVLLHLNSMKSSSQLESHSEFGFIQVPPAILLHTCLSLVLLDSGSTQRRNTFRLSAPSKINSEFVSTQVTFRVETLTSYTQSLAPFKFCQKTPPFPTIRSVTSLSLLEPRSWHQLLRPT